MPGVTARERVSTGRSGSDQENRGTDVEKIPDNVWWRTWRRKQAGGLDTCGQNREFKHGHRLINRIITQDDELRVAPDSVTRTELHDVIGIVFTRRLCKETQRARDGVMFVLGTLALVMQHESHPVAIWLKDCVMVRVNSSQDRRHTHADGRKSTHVQQQPEPSGKKPE